MLHVCVLVSDAEREAIAVEMGVDVPHSEAEKEESAHQATKTLGKEEVTSGGIVEASSQSGGASKGGKKSKRKKNKGGLEYVVLDTCYLV